MVKILLQYILTTFHVHHTIISYISYLTLISCFNLFLCLNGGSICFLYNNGLQAVVGTVCHFFLLWHLGQSQVCFCSVLDSLSFFFLLQEFKVYSQQQSKFKTSLNYTELLDSLLKDRFLDFLSVFSNLTMSSNELTFTLLV